LVLSELLLSCLVHNAIQILSYDNWIHHGQYCFAEVLANNSQYFGSEHDLRPALYFFFHFFTELDLYSLLVVLNRLNYFNIFFLVIALLLLQFFFLFFLLFLVVLTFLLGAEEAGLHGEAVNDGQLLEKHYPSGCFFLLLHGESAVLQAEGFKSVRQEGRKDSDQGVVSRVERKLRKRAAVHEHVVLSRVAVDVSEELNGPVQVQHFYHLLAVEYSRMQNLGGVDPSSVKIHAQQGASVVAVNDSVRV